MARYAQGALVNPHGPRFERPGFSQYGNRRGASIGYIEFCNEPNLLPWPQSPPGQPVDGRQAICATIDMFTTVENYAYYYPCRILGPGTADIVSTSTTAYTDYRAFTAGVVSGLQNWRPRVSCGWSHHNYHDIGGNKNSRYEEVRKALRDNGWWDPRAAIWITEGGYNVGEIPPLVSPAEPTQDSRIRSGWANFQYASDLHEWAQELGRVYAFAQHTIGDTSPRTESWSLRRSDGSARPAYNAWRDLPGNPGH
jgi:hypothetical protein